MLFAGFFIPPETIPVWLRWLRYVSFIKYAFAAAMQTEYAGRTLDLSGCVDSMSLCYPDGKAVLAHFSLDDIPMWANFALLLSLIAFMRVAGYLVLLHKGPKFDTTI